MLHCGRCSWCIHKLLASQQNVQCMFTPVYTLLPYYTLKITKNEIVIYTIFKQGTITSTYSDVVWLMINTSLFVV